MEASNYPVKLVASSVVVLLSTAWWIRSRRQRRRAVAAQALKSNGIFPISIVNSACTDGGITFSSVQFVPPRLASVSVRCPLFTSIDPSSGFPIESCCFVVDSVPKGLESDNQDDGLLALVQYYVAHQCPYLLGVAHKKEVHCRDQSPSDDSDDGAAAASPAVSPSSQHADAIFPFVLEVDADSIVLFHPLPAQRAVLGMIVTLSEGNHVHHSILQRGSKDVVTSWIREVLSGIAVDSTSLVGEPLPAGSVTEFTEDGTAIYTNAALGIRFTLPTPDCSVNVVHFNPSNTLASGLDRGVVMQLGTQGRATVEIAKWQALPSSWIRPTALEEAVLASEELRKTNGGADSNLHWREHLFRFNVALHLMSPNLPTAEAERLYSLADTLVGLPSAAQGILEAVESGSVLKGVPAMRILDVNGHVGLGFTETIMDATCDTILVLPPTKHRNAKWDPSSLIVLRHQREKDDADASEALFSKFWDSLNLYLSVGTATPGARIV